MCAEAREQGRSERQRTPDFGGTISVAISGRVTESLAQIVSKARQVDAGLITPPARYSSINKTTALNFSFPELGED